MTIRPATHADLPAILEIYNEQVLNSTATYDYEPDTLEGRAGWLEEHEREGYPVLVAEDEAGRVVGWASLSRFRAKIGYRFTVENSLYVAADRRGQGIGRALLAALIKSARERGFHAIVAGIDADSEASLRLHESFGFEKVAHFKQVGFKFGRLLDVVFMELLLVE
jgi:L-amino acid N-acyltransferase YncA